MKQVSVTVPESFYKTFIDFLKHVPEAKIEEMESFSIPQWHKEQTLQRLKTAKQADFIPWTKAKKQLKSAENAL
jgi:hypothetical protein